jgi:hypothetical protein
MKVISFITKHSVVDKIVRHLGIKFACQRPPPADLVPASPNTGSEGVQNTRKPEAACAGPKPPPNSEKEVPRMVTTVHGIGKKFGHISRVYA